MFCLLSGCTLKKIYYPAYVGYDMYGRPVQVYDYYVVDIDDPKNAKYRTEEDGCSCTDCKECN